VAQNHNKNTQQLEKDIQTFFLFSHVSKFYFILFFSSASSDQVSEVGWDEET
jgi:hypothetical protein